MAGKIIADTIETGAGADISTSYVVNGSAKAWAFLSTNAYTLSNSLNISSSIDNSTGRPEVNFSSSFGNANIVGTGGAYNRIVGQYDTDGGITTSSFAHALIDSSGSFVDSAELGTEYNGDLA